MTQERIDKVNKWLETVTSIETDRVSYYRNEDPFTKWDYESYNIVKFKDGRVTRDLIYKDTPSERLHHINDILTSWGFILQSKTFNSNRVCDGDFRWSGPITFKVEMNTFHTTLFKLNTSNNYITYSRDFIEGVIEDLFISEISNGNKELNREMKIRAITRTNGTE